MHATRFTSRRMLSLYACSILCVLRSFVCLSNGLVMFLKGPFDTTAAFDTTDTSSSTGCCTCLRHVRMHSHTISIYAVAVTSVAVVAGWQVPAAAAWCCRVVWVVCVAGLLLRSTGGAVNHSYQQQFRLYLLPCPCRMRTVSAVHVAAQF